MKIKVCGFDAEFCQETEKEFDFKLKIYSKDGQEIQIYQGEVDLDVIKQIEKFYEINSRFPSSSLEIK